MPCVLPSTDVVNLLLQPDMVFLENLLSYMLDERSYIGACGLFVGVDDEVCMPG